MRILVDQTCPQPPVANKPSTIPRSWEDHVKQDINCDVQLEVIKKVPENTPQTYCACMHVVAKHNGDPRRVMDFTELNRVSIRQTHSTVKPFDLAVWILTGSIMSQFDCWNG